MLKVGSAFPGEGGGGKAVFLGAPGTGTGTGTGMGFRFGSNQANRLHTQGEGRRRVVTKR